MGTLCGLRAEDFRAIPTPGHPNAMQSTRKACRSESNLLRLTSRGTGQSNQTVIHITRPEVSRHRSGPGALAATSSAHSAQVYGLALG